ncbi:MAG: acylneuraminate cytidylyltransferase family protein [Acidobacteria bacterium]|nr:acylneuraminate cytidylyltransferase family protein [Acidobacteriota bacterium]
MSTPRVLALVPARGGSKGVPDKNTKLLAGRTLLDYVAAAATASGVVDRIVLSTDSERIAAEGRRAGLDVPFLRPADLARDDTPMFPVIEHAVDALRNDGWVADIVVLLQPTSPLRRGEHIRRAVQQLRTSGADSVVTVVELPRHLSPDYVMRVVAGRLEPFLAEGEHVTRRQDARAAFVRDGTVYAFWSRTLQETRSIYGRDCRPLVLDEAESITIDTPRDWAEAERRLRVADA